jgi:hypothetical protein
MHCHRKLLLLGSPLRCISAVCAIEQAHHRNCCAAAVATNGLKPGHLMLLLHPLLLLLLLRVLTPSCRQHSSTLMSYLPLQAVLAAGLLRGA